MTHNFPVILSMAFRSVRQHSHILPVQDKQPSRHRNELLFAVIVWLPGSNDDGGPYSPAGECLRVTFGQGCGRGDIGRRYNTHQFSFLPGFQHYRTITRSSNNGSLPSHGRTNLFFVGIIVEGSVSYR